MHPHVRSFVMTTEAQSLHNRTQLATHFDSFKARDAQSAGWSSLWESDKSDLWDRGRCSPALVAFLHMHSNGRALLSSERQLKALVPGCGRGHDVAMLALNGFEAWGLEVSNQAVKVANENISSKLANPPDDSFGEYKTQRQLGSSKVILGDFFQRDWEDQIVSDSNGFDLIYDYTFLCALLPEMRKDWVRRMSELLSPTGVLICLEFPLWKPLTAQGPPWGLNGVHWNILAEGGDGIVDKSGHLPKSGGDNGVFERVTHWKPPVSFEQSRGEDMISVWKLK